MLFCTVLASQWPREITIENFSNDTSDYFYNVVFRNITKEQKDNITNLIDFINSTYNVSESKLHAKEIKCNDIMCGVFTEEMGLKPVWFYIYHAFIDQILDPMLAFKYYKENDTEYNLFGYAMTVSNGHPDARRLYELVESLIIEMKLNNSDKTVYTALTIAGYGGYLAVDHVLAKQEAAYTHDFGLVQEVQPYNKSKFIDSVLDSAEKISNAIYPPSYYMLDYCLKSTSDSVDGNLCNYLSTVSFNSKKIIGCVEYGFASFFNQSSYKRTINETGNIAQSSCELNISTPILSDSRILEVESQLNATKEKITLADFYNQLRKYPFRTTYTMALTAFDTDGNEMNGLHMCTSIYDSLNKVVSCADPPPPTNWWSVVCSIVLIILVVVAWTFGCIFAKREEAKLKKQEEHDAVFVGTDDTDDGIE